jgi:hypothetical protein
VHRRPRKLSLLSIVVVMDEEDCSSKITEHFTSGVGPDSPLGKNGRVQSICQDDFGPAIDNVIEDVPRLRAGSGVVIRNREVCHSG